MSKGLWIVVEGPDGVGKTTCVNNIERLLMRSMPDLEVINTKHPGATRLGAHIRNLTKNPDAYDVGDIDSLSHQLLMAVDQIHFNNFILEPALDRGAVVLADRCNLVSGIIYGSATGLSLPQINAVLTLACRFRVDRLYVLKCGRDIIEERIRGRAGKADRFESSPRFRTRVSELYDTLLSGTPEEAVLLNKIVGLENVKYINADRSEEEVTIEVVKDLRELIKSHLRSQEA